MFNLGTGNGYTVLGMVSAFEKAVVMNISHELVQPRAGDVSLSFAAVKKLTVN